MAEGSGVRVEDVPGVPDDLGRNPPTDPPQNERYRPIDEVHDPGEGFDTSKAK